MNNYLPLTAPTKGPCWTCHWFGFLMAENNHAMCVNPALCPIRATPSDGCAFWVKGDGGSMARLEHDSPEREAINVERDRLEKILELGRRAESKLPYGVYVEVVNRGGLLTLSVPPHSHYRGGTVEELMPIVERTGVNNAIRAGRL